MDGAPEGRPVRIRAIRVERPEVKTFLLEPADGLPIIYEAGQFLTLSFTLAGKAARRPYSFSSSPAADKEPAITVKRVGNGAYSRWLIDYARPGDLLYATGISGLFTLPGHPDEYAQVLLFAAGIGITPVRSLLLELLSRNDNTIITLLYSNSSRSNAVFYDELVSLQMQHSSRLEIEWLFSDAKNLERARISKALLPRLLNEYLKVPPAKALCYICGPEDYRWLLTLLLSEAGMPQEHIRREIFAPGRTPKPALPPDTAAHTVTLELGNEKYTLPVQYPETILNAAKKAGIPLPYSCSAGRCASCIMRCTGGQVWMSYNEVLTAKDIRAGLVLTCTGYPAGGDVVLELL